MRTTLILIASVIAAVQLQTAPQERASLRGVVTDRDTGRPLARAIVRLLREDPPTRLYARTGDDGRFEFTDLEPGEYLGSVEPGEHRATHIMQSLGDARTSYRITLWPGETREINTALQRTRAITVRVTDAWGGALAGMQVWASSVSGGVRRSGLGNALTDDRGRLRVYGLLPGKYILCVEPGQPMRTTGGTQPAGNRFVKTCHPSATNEHEAVPVVLNDVDVDGVEIQMQRAGVFSITGSVVDSTGTPVGRAFVSLDVSEPGRSSGTSAMLGADGRFTFRNVVSGLYALTMQIGGPNRPEDGRPREAAFLPLRVEGNDITDLTLRTTPTVDVRGRLVLEDESQTLSRAPGSEFIIAARLTDDPTPGGGSRRSVAVREQRDFVLEGIFGPRRLEFANVPPGWFVKSVKYDSEDVTDRSVDFRPGSDAELEILLSTRGAFATGRVLDGLGNPQVGGRVLVVRADQPLGGYESYLSAPVKPDGTFRTGPVRPGAYVLIALGRGVPVPHPGDIPTLTALREKGERITLVGEGEHPIDLRVAPR